MRQVGEKLFLLLWDFFVLPLMFLGGSFSLGVSLLMYIVVLESMAWCFSSVWRNSWLLFFEKFISLFIFCYFFLRTHCPYIIPYVMFLVSPMLFSMVSILFVLNVSVWGFLFLILLVVIVVIVVCVISSLQLSKINLMVFVFCFCTELTMLIDISYLMKYS